MESDWLKKEDEFYKENEKLELKTKELLKNINDVLKSQENQIDAKNYEVEKLFNFNKESEEIIRDETSGGGGGGAILQAYKTKLKTSLLEKETLKAELRKMHEERQKLHKENTNLKDEKEKWFLLHHSGKTNVTKLEGQLRNVQAKNQNKETENCTLKKELEHLKKDLKLITINLNNTELRLNRANEECDKIRDSLKSSKEIEKELKDSMRKQTNEYTSLIKKLEKDKLELLEGFKKQMQLIETLKKQKIHIEALKLAELSDNEYMKLLDFKLFKN